MMRAQRVQGSLFLVCALAVITASLILPRFDRSAELIAVAFAVLLLGVPHGALDPLFVRRLPGANSIGGWAAFGVGYAALAAAVVGLWVAAPSLFLAGFLLISALHFSGDPGPRTSGFSRLIYGGAIIVVPALLHPAEMEGLFAALAGHPAASSVQRHAPAPGHSRPLAGLGDRLRCHRRETRSFGGRRNRIGWRPSRGRAAARRVRHVFLRNA
jgi:hypothetical protein